MKTQLTVATIVVICIAIIASIGRASINLKTDDIEIGVLACLTTECAEWGSNSLKGLQLATKEINARGGILGRKVTLRVQDTAEGKGGAATVSAYRRLASTNNLQLYVGPTWTPAALALAPIVSKQKIVMTSPSVGVADFNEAGPNLFNTWPHDAESSKALARYAIKQGWKRAAVFSSQQPWEHSQGQFFIDEFTQNGGEISQLVDPLPGSPDLHSEALRITASNPDVVVFSNFQQLGSAAKAVRQLSKAVQFLTVLVDDTRIGESQGALEGAIVPRHSDPSQEFQVEFEKEFGMKPGSSADTSYDTLMLYAKAITKAQGTDPERVSAAMRGLEIKGASGPLKFDDSRGLISAPTLYVIINGTPKIL